MKRLYICDLLLLMQILSTRQETVIRSNTTILKDGTLILFPTSTMLTSLNQKTVSMYRSSDMLLGLESTNTRSVQSSNIFSHILANSPDQRTRSQSERNLYKSTQSKTVRNLFKSTQSYHQSTALESGLWMQPTRTSVYYKTTETSQVNPSSRGVQKSRTIAIGDSQIVQCTTKPSQSVGRYITSSALVGKSTTIYQTIVRNATNGLQSNVVVISSSISNSKTVEPNVFSSRSRERIKESNSNNRFPSSTQTQQSSQIIKPSLSRTDGSATESLKTQLSSSSISGNHSNSHQISTLTNFKTSRTPALSRYTSSQANSHGNGSYLPRTKYLSSTANKMSSNRIFTTTVFTSMFQNISQTLANRGSVEKLQSTSFSKDIISNSFIDQLSFSTLEAGLSSRKSDFQSTIKASSEVKGTVCTTNYQSQKLATEIHFLSSRVTTTRYQSSGDGQTTMPLYILAISLPLTLLLGFTLALVYFKRTKEDQRVRYSVTVEITSENPDQELKRMYSIIDVTSGINKDFLAGLESKKSSTGVLDQLDTVSVSISQPDQTV